MHQLFRLVLGQKDLSRAGDLFSLDDSEIEDSLTEALEQIKIISSSLVSKLVFKLDTRSNLESNNCMYILGERIFAWGKRKDHLILVPFNPALWFHLTSKK